jgi:hypothetical protein
MLAKEQVASNPSQGSLCGSLQAPDRICCLASTAIACGNPWGMPHELQGLLAAYWQLPLAIAAS